MEPWGTTSQSTTVKTATTATRHKKAPGLRIQKALQTITNQSISLSLSLSHFLTLSLSLSLSVSLSLSLSLSLCLCRSLSPQPETLSSPQPETLKPKSIALEPRDPHRDPLQIPCGCLQASLKGIPLINPEAFENQCTLPEPPKP